MFHSSEPRAMARGVKAVLGATALATLGLMIPLAQGTFASSPHAAGTAPFTQTYQLSCNAPVVGALTVAMTISGTAPTSVSPGETFFITNSSATLTIPSSAIGAATGLLGATAITITASEFVVSDNGTPATVNLGAAPFGPLVSASTPISGSNPATVTVPATPIAQVGPVIPPASGSFTAFPGASIADISFTTTGGKLDLGNTNCAAPSNPAPMVTIPVGAGTTTTQPAGPATVSSVLPSQGPLAGGETVTLSGSGFTGATQVSFGSTAGTNVNVLSDSQLTVVSPAGASGQVSLTVTTPSGTSSGGPGYTYTDGPIVTSVSPTSGPPGGGTSVTVSGFNLTGATGVSFGSAAATGIQVASATQLTAVSPAGSPGAVDITVTSPNGTSAKSSLDQFTYGSPPPASQGYWIAGSDGSVYAFGAAQYLGGMGGTALQSPVLAIAATPDDQGYWMVAGDGGVFAFGDAKYYGSMAGSPLQAPIVGITATSDGRGYYLLGSDGGVFAFGDAQPFGSLVGQTLNGAFALQLVLTPSGNGYAIVDSVGDVWEFGDAINQLPSLSGTTVSTPVVSLQITNTLKGAWLMGNDGVIGIAGDAKYFDDGTPGQHDLSGTTVTSPIMKLQVTPDDGGYWMVGNDGAVYAFGDAQYLGGPMSVTGGPMPFGHGIVGIAGF